MRDNIVRERALGKMLRPLDVVETGGVTEVLPEGDTVVSLEIPLRRSPNAGPGNPPKAHLWKKIS